MSAQRDDSIDLMRGIVIVFMALDHVRGFLAPFSPEDLDKTDLLFFFTRWITHFCAPTFLFLAGVGAGMHALKRGLPATRRFLFTRGLWLMFLECTWVSFSWYFSFEQIQLGVLWAIGGSMLILAALSWIPARAVGFVGVLATVAFALAGPVAEGNALTGLLVWPTAIEVLGRPVYMVYVAGPWAAVMAMGYGATRLVTERRRHLPVVGVALFCAFLALRGLNGFGNSTAWAAHADWSMTLAHFLNPNKYPPSLQFQLMTLGPMLAVLPLLSRWKGFVADRFEVFGRVPMFFYLLHLPLIHAITWGINHVRFGTEKYPPDEPLELVTIYAVFIGVVVLLAPVCSAWAKLKRTKSWWWLSYL